MSISPNEFELDIRFTKAPNATPAAAPTGDCTDDTCGETPGSAGIADC
ncbi:hypothetical protein ABZ897_52865 [Nonomuraea sp. NPDC046802]